jgi:hypothetical protein
MRRRRSTPMRIIRPPLVLAALPFPEPCLFLSARALDT